MFFEASKQKVLVMMGILAVIIVGVGASIVLDKSFDISKRAEVVFVMSKAKIAYTWKKFQMTGGENGQALAFNLSSAVIASEGLFRSLDYYESKSNDHNLSAKSVPVLAYHGLPSEGEGHIPFKNFMAQMFALKNTGWRTVTLAQFESYLIGELELPDKSFLLTFDDGRKDTYYPVDPVLKDLGFSAVMFVITGQSLRQDPTNESNYYLSTIELQKMIESGRWELGSHTRKGHSWYPVNEEGLSGHFLSNKLWIFEESRLESEDEFQKRIATDLQGSKSDIEFTFGNKITSFAFPFSDFGEESINFEDSKKIIEEIVRLNYQVAFYQADNSKGDIFNYPNDEAFMIKRIEPLPSWSVEKLMEVMDTGIAKTLPYKSDSFGAEWRGSWGQVNLGDTLLLKSGDATTGSAAALNGSYLWRDYFYTANVSLVSGRDILLIARYKDNNNYFACDFSAERVNLKQQMNGVFETISFAKNQIINLKNQTSLGMRVEGDVVACFVEGEEVLSANMPAKLKNGGVGIHIWSDVVGGSNASVHSVEAREL